MELVNALTQFFIEKLHHSAVFLEFVFGVVYVFCRWHHFQWLIVFKHKLFFPELFKPNFLPRLQIWRKIRTWRCKSNVKFLALVDFRIYYIILISHLFVIKIDILRYYDFLKLVVLVLLFANYIVAFVLDFSSLVLKLPLCPAEALKPSLNEAIVEQVNVWQGHQDQQVVNCNYDSRKDAKTAYRHNWTEARR